MSRTQRIQCLTRTTWTTQDRGLPSLSTHLRVSGCPWRRLHMSLTSSQSSSKVLAASKLVISMSLDREGRDRHHGAQVTRYTRMID